MYGVVDDGRGPFGGEWRPITDLGKDDWVIYLRIQKTGSQTFWQTLQQAFDGRVWGRNRMCQRGLFCGHRCASVADDQITEILKSRLKARPQAGAAHRSHPRAPPRAPTRPTRAGRHLLASRPDPDQCSLVFRGHVNWQDYLRGFKEVWAKQALVWATEPSESLVPPGAPLPRVFYLTFLREPVGRAVSEFRHITEGLVAQFGPHTFGAAWDYNFTFDPKAPIEEKRRVGTFSAWLRCPACRVGSANRMTRFLGSGTGTGELTAEEDALSRGANAKAEAVARRAELIETGKKPGPEIDDQVLEAVRGAVARAGERMLGVARARLTGCAFVGLMERYEDSMLVLKRTFPSSLKGMTSFASSPHAKGKGPERPISAGELASLRELNALDVVLYAHAAELFEARLTSMRDALPPAIATLAFKSDSKAKGNQRAFFRIS